MGSNKEYSAFGVMEGCLIFNSISSKVLNEEIPNPQLFLTYFFIYMHFGNNGIVSLNKNKITNNHVAILVLENTNPTYILNTCAHWGVFIHE